MPFVTEHNLVLYLASTQENNACNDDFSKVVRALEGETCDRDATFVCCVASEQQQQHSNRILWNLWVSLHVKTDSDVRKEHVYTAGILLYGCQKRGKVVLRRLKLTRTS